jgi:hypothetical protein
MERRKKFLIFRDGREGEEEKKSPKKTSTLRRGKRNFFPADNLEDINFMLQ